MVGQRVLEESATIRLVTDNKDATEESAAADGDGEPARISWKSITGGGWTVADRRLLMITIIAGLIVNLLTVLVIALALLIAHFHLKSLPGNIFRGVILALALAAVIFWREILSGRPSGRMARSGITFLRVAFLLLLIASILGIIGSAAGVK
jgi:hypothetical protein